MWQLLLLMFVNLHAKESAFYDTFHGEAISQEALKQHIKANTTFFCTIEIEPCDPNEGRRLDGSCNNLQQPSRGAGRTPFKRVLPPHYGRGFEPRPAHTGDPLPQSRRVRTTLLASGIRPDHTFTQLATHFFVFVASDVVNVQDTINYILWKPYCCLPKGKSDPICTPITIPNDDPVHRFSDLRCLNLTRPISYQLSGCLINGTTPERINAATPLFDLSILYGSTTKSALEKGRMFSGGLLKFELENNRVWPPRTRTLPNLCLLNEAPHETRCHNTPEDGINTLFGINIVSIWFWRNHNRIASELAVINPCWNDDKLFYTARDINIATCVQIFYYEFLPILLGWDNLMKDSVLAPNPGFRDVYNSNVMPQITLEFPYILRWAHLMQEGRLKMYDQGGNYLKQIPVVNLTLRTGYLAIDDNIDHMTQGSFRQASGKVDYVIDPDMADVVLGGHQRASDVATSDLTKGRYFGFPSYIKYREYCSGSRETFNSFDDFSDLIDADKLELLKDLYKDIHDIELMAGVWVEKPVRGGYAPPTFYCLMVDQLIRSMVSDRHWYERPNRPNAFSSRQLQEIRKATISQLLCDVGDKVTQIQRHGFIRASPTDKMIFCKDIVKIDLKAWRDRACG
ncbi:peroxidase-like [Cydia amplana]|uniref:peroxidase-like n=1 Tax=Cydia amplana TaxID=1869771 RepID=UPI002FE6372B